MSDVATTTAATAPSSRSFFWPALICSLLVVHILSVCVMVYVATRDRSFAIEPDYYQKGLNWDKTANQQRENARLGWTVAIEIGEPAGVRGERTVTCKVTDKAGRPVEGAIVDLVAFAHARASERTAAVMVPQGQGAYQSSLRMLRRGLWEFRLVIARGRDTVTFTEQRRV
jgi:nitrogen fixation protein FixH